MNTIIINWIVRQLEFATRNILMVSPQVRFAKGQFASQLWNSFGIALEQLWNSFGIMKYRDCKIKKRPDGKYKIVGCIEPLYIFVNGEVLFDDIEEVNIHIDEAWDNYETHYG